MIEATTPVLERAIGIVMVLPRYRVEQRQFS
jgi:hypothetical protein